MLARIVLIASLCLAPAIAVAAAAPFSVAQRADLSRVSAYLNSIQTAEGRFVQIGPDGRSETGTLYLRKPGRLRFEYDKPNPTLVVADGSAIAVSNTRLRTTDRYPLLDSPLRLLLSDKINLATDPRIVGAKREAGLLTVTARQTAGPAQGEIILTFADTGASLELRQWEALDAQALRTQVSLSGLKTGGTLAPSLFIIQDLDPFQRLGTGRPQ